MADRAADRTKPALFAALLALLLLDAAWLGWGERLELAAGDRLLARHAATRTPDPDVLVEHVASLLSVHKRPRQIHVVDALPRNAMGKVQKQLLRS